MTPRGRARKRKQAADDRRALGHIRGRTLGGRFAAKLWDWDERRWREALARLRAQGHQIEWVAGIVADEPTVAGGWVLRHSHPSTALSRARGLASRRRRLRQTLATRTGR